MPVRPAAPTPAPPAPTPSSPAPTTGSNAPADLVLPFKAGANGLLMEGTLMHSLLKAGSTLTVTAKLTKTGKENVPIGGCNPIVWLDVMQGNGLVAAGKPPARVPCTLMAMVLRPGASNQYSAKVTLPGNPGTYDLVVHGTDNLSTRRLLIKVTA